MEYKNEDMLLMEDEKADVLDFDRKRQGEDFEKILETLDLLGEADLKKVYEKADELLLKKYGARMHL